MGTKGRCTYIFLDTTVKSRKLWPVWIFQCEKNQVVRRDWDSGFGYSEPDKEFSGNRISAFLQHTEGFLPILIRNIGENVSCLSFAMGRLREEDEQG